jgi:hypothetical protein
MTLVHTKLHHCVVLFILLITTINFAQTNSIVLERKGKDRQIVVKENNRVKITTVEGEKFVGRFSIIDEHTIQINGKAILLDSIATFEKRSTFSSIIRPITISTGIAFVIVGIAGAVSGGYGYLLTVTMIPIGTPMILINVFFNKHKSEKWNYRIEQIE